MFVCVEVLRPSQPNGVMSSVVNLPNHTFTGQAQSSKRLTSIVHILLPETDNCPSWISGRERMTVQNISWYISTKKCCRLRRGSNPPPPGLQSDMHPTEPPRLAQVRVGIRICFFFFLHKNILCRYSLEAPCWGLLMSTHKICFCGAIWKISVLFAYLELCMCFL